MSLSLQYNRILYCPSGASSFVAEAKKIWVLKQLDEISCLVTRLERLVKRGKEDINNVIEKVKISPHLYNWNFYKSIEGLIEYRTLALKRFAIDYCKGISEGDI